MNLDFFIKNSLDYTKNASEEIRKNEILRIENSLIRLMILDSFKNNSPKKIIFFKDIILKNKEHFDCSYRTKDIDYGKILTTESVSSIKNSLEDQEKLTNNLEKILKEVLKQQGRSIDERLLNKIIENEKENIVKISKFKKNDNIFKNKLLQICNSIVNKTCMNHELDLENTVKNNFITLISLIMNSEEYKKKLYEFYSLSKTKNLSDFHSNSVKIVRFIIKNNYFEDNFEKNLSNLIRDFDNMGERFNTMDERFLKKLNEYSKDKNKDLFGKRGYLETEFYKFIEKYKKDKNFRESIPVIIEKEDNFDLFKLFCTIVNNGSNGEFSALGNNNCFKNSEEACAFFNYMVFCDKDMIKNLEKNILFFRGDCLEKRMSFITQRIDKYSSYKNSLDLTYGFNCDKEQLKKFIIKFLEKRFSQKNFKNKYLINDFYNRNLIPYLQEPIAARYIDEIKALKSVIAGKTRIKPSSYNPFGKSKVKNKIPDDKYNSYRYNYMFLNVGESSEFNRTILSLLKKNVIELKKQTKNIFGRNFDNRIRRMEFLFRSESRKEKDRRYNQINFLENLSKKCDKNLKENTKIFELCNEAISEFERMEIKENKISK